MEMHAKPYGLEQTLRSLPEPSSWPLSLPVSHLSVARWFESVINAGKLEPRFCDIFNESLIYLFYGGVFYRTATMATKNAAELPIVFIFHPSLLQSVDRYYPFDTGGLAKRRFGDWTDKLVEYQERFRISGASNSTVPSRLVYHLYGGNKGYLRGEVNPDLKNKPEPLPQLFEFLAADLTQYGVDQRQASIEAHCKQAVPFDRDLLWVAFPDIKTKEFRPLFAQLYNWTKPSTPKFFAYRSHSIISPREIAAQLQMAAHDAVIADFVQLPGEGDD